MRPDLVPGAVFPDYQLPDHTGTPRRLSELQGDDPLILTLSRGHYCPKEHQQHLDLAGFYPKIAVGYTQIVTISTDDRGAIRKGGWSRGKKALVGAAIVGGIVGAVLPHLHGIDLRSEMVLPVASARESNQESAVVLPVSTRFPLWIGCGIYQEYPNGYLLIHRTVPPFVRSLLTRRTYKSALGLLNSVDQRLGVV
jgi:hypothetical protein